MHELSIAMSMIDMAQQEAARRGGVRVVAVHLKLGPLSGVVSDALQFSWDVACEDTSIAGARLVIDETPIVIHCPVCQTDKTLARFQPLCCPVCDSPTSDILQGAELELVALEIQE